MCATVALNFYLWAGYLMGAYARDGSSSIAETYFWLLHRHGL